MWIGEKQFISGEHPNNGNRKQNTYDIPTHFPSYGRDRTMSSEIHKLLLLIWFMYEK